jgi:hypothetical protein
MCKYKDRLLLVPVLGRVKRRVRKPKGPLRMRRRRLMKERWSQEPMRRMESLKISKSRT